MESVCVVQEIEGVWDDLPWDLESVTYVHAFVQGAYLKVLQGSNYKKYLPLLKRIKASVRGPMQCMLKGVCAQCLQWQIDPEQGGRMKAVFACSWQDQPIELIDADHLAMRQSHSAFDVLNYLWLAYLQKES